MDLTEHLKTHYHVGSFEPSGFYNPDGDQMHIWWDDKRTLSEQINSKGRAVMSIHSTEEDESLKTIGVTLYSIKEILRKSGYNLVKLE
jgi:hypothetical protein